MKINQFTSAAQNVNNSNYPAFTGRVIVKGKWTEELKDAFFKSNAVNELASGNKDVIGRLVYKDAPRDDYNHTWGEPIFKLSLEMKNPNPSLKEKIKSMLGISRKIINKYYHSEPSMVQKMQDMSKEFLEARMAENLKK